MALFSVEMSRSRAFWADNLFPELPRVPGSLAPNIPCSGLPRLISQGDSCFLSWLETSWSWDGLTAHRATSRVKSRLSQAASPLASLLNLKAKWTSCCGKPWFQRIKRSSAGEACQKGHRHCLCRWAERHCNVARCPAKRGTSFTLRAAGFLTGAILLLGQEMLRNTVPSSWGSAAAPCLLTHSGSKSDYHTKFSQEEGHFLYL